MNELKAVTEINEEINSIMSVAEGISLTASHVMRAARQVGIDAGGFCMVARELRMYSENIGAAMQTLSGLVYWQAEVNASKCLRIGKPDRLIETGAQSREGQEGIAQSWDADEIEGLIVSQVRDLQIMVRHIGKQCATGLQIACSTNIEAPCDEPITSVLREIAQDVDAIIGNIAGRVNKLESRLTKLSL